MLNEKRIPNSSFSPCYLNRIVDRIYIDNKEQQRFLNFSGKHSFFSFSFLVHVTLTTYIHNSLSLSIFLWVFPIRYPVVCAHVNAFTFGLSLVLFFLGTISHEVIPMHEFLAFIQLIWKIYNINCPRSHEPGLSYMLLNLIHFFYFEIHKTKWLNAFHCLVFIKCLICLSGIIMSIFLMFFHKTQFFPIFLVWIWVLWCFRTHSDVTKLFFKVPNLRELPMT